MTHITAFKRSLGAFAIVALLMTMGISAAKAQTLPDAAVSIVNMAFDPATLSVGVGTKVVWTNNDTVAHTVTFADAVDSGSLDPGATFERTFALAGTFAYSCTLHPTMTASVVVTPPAEPEQPVDQPAATQVKFTLNGTLEAVSATEVTVNVTQASSSVKSAKGKSVPIMVAPGKVIKQDGKTVKQPEMVQKLVVGSTVKVKGKFNGTVYAADSVLARATQFTMVGVVVSVDTDALTFVFKTTKKTKKLPKGEMVTVQWVDGTSQIRIDGTAEALDAVKAGMKGNVTGYMYMKDSKYMFTAKKVVLKGVVE